MSSGDRFGTAKSWSIDWRFNGIIADPTYKSQILVSFRFAQTLTFEEDIDLDEEASTKILGWSCYDRETASAWSRDQNMARRDKEK